MAERGAFPELRIMSILEILFIYVFNNFFICHIVNLYKQTLHPVLFLLPHTNSITSIFIW